MNKEIILDLLAQVKREGMENLVNYLNQTDYFDAPASTRFHGNFEKGLMIHSYNVYQLFHDNIKKFNINLKHESIIICGLFHDICKIGMYTLKNGKSKLNPHFGHKGHSKLSIKRLSSFIELTEKEEEIIRFHMGMYGTHEFSKFGEYSLEQLGKIYNKNPVAKLFYFCDDMATNFMEETT